MTGHLLTVKRSWWGAVRVMCCQCSYRRPVAVVWPWQKQHNAWTLTENDRDRSRSVS